MSVIIKGMEMPVSGTTYRVVEDLEGNKYLTLDGVFDGRYYSISTLPKRYGRLIDADEAYDRIMEQEGGNLVDMDCVGMGLEECKTIVEAEGDN